MSAIKKSSFFLLCMALATISLVGVFSIIHISAARAGQSYIPPQINNPQTSIIVSPAELEATLYPDELVTHILLITNTGETPLSYTIYEMTASLGLTEMVLQRHAVPVVAPEAQSQITQNNEALVIISLRETPDLSAAYSILEKATRRQYVYNRLLETASRSQELFKWLESQGSQPQRLLAANAITAVLNKQQLTIVAENPQVRSIQPNQQFSVTPSAQTTPTLPRVPTVSSAQPDTVEWNIHKIRADEVWSTLGVTGTGAVVGIVDTGVMYEHLALVNSYRGNLGDGSFDHNYNWFDPYHGSPEPNDDYGHGTMLTGIVSGTDGGENQIGVAPGADWIAAKACDGVVCSEIGIYASLEWILAPTDLSEEHTDPSKAPDIVFGGWGSGGCFGFLEMYINTLRSAGILPIFGGGGGGPACGSIGCPAELGSVLAAGATDANDLIGALSPRGPSNWGQIKPDVAAPGVNIRSSFNNGGYQVWSGSAEASAHAAGTAALILSANPSLGPNEVEEVLYSTALCLDDPTCGGGPCPEPNNVFGHGRIDAFQAVSMALGNPPQVDLPWLSEAPISGIIAVSESIAIQVTFYAAGLSGGEYTGFLGILSSDPTTPFTSVPVTLNVILPCEPITSLYGDNFPHDPSVGQVVTFTADANGTLPITYTWDFDDGTSGNGAQLTHVFDHVGIFNVELSAQNGCSTSEMIELIVPVSKVCQPVTGLGAQYFPPELTTGATVTFTASATGTLPIMYTWGVEDSLIGSGEQINFTFMAPGMHSISLVGQNPCTSPPVELEMDLMVKALFLLPIINR